MIIDVIENFSQVNTTLDYLLKENKLPSVLSVVDYNKSGKYIGFFFSMYSCITESLFLCNSLSNLEKEKRINLIKKGMDQLEKIVDSWSDKGLDFNYNFTQKYIKNSVKILSISANIIINSLRNNRIVNLQMKMDCLFSDFLQGWRKFPPKQRVHISSFILLVFSHQTYSHRDENAMVIQQFVDILEATIKEYRNLDDYFLIIQHFLKIIHAVDCVNIRIIPNENKKKFLI